MNKIINQGIKSMSNKQPLKQTKDSSGTTKQSQNDQRIYFNDTVYGRIHFNELIVKFIDTPHVQRLRNIRQIRTLQYVFPCASHFTFQHALGTAHLAKILIQTLIENNPRHYQDENALSIIKTVTLAGLLYNIGHAPFNHIFDNEVIKEINYNGKKIKWNHQIATQKLILSMIKQQKITEFLIQNQSETINNYQPTKIYRSQINRIIKLIKGIPDDIRPWQFQIINNKKYGIDVNKIDSLKRDGMSVRADNINLNVEELIDSLRIDQKFAEYRQSNRSQRESTKNAKQGSKNHKIFDKQACLALPQQNFPSIYNIYRFRYMIYKIYHFNVVNQGIQMMIADILKYADKIFNLRQACLDLYSDPKKAISYINLNDGILDLILQQYDLRKQQPNNQYPYDEQLKKSCDLIIRLRKRNLYRFVYEFFYKIQEYQDEEVAQILEELSQEYLIKGIAKYSYQMKENICVNIKEIDLGAKKHNPMKKVKFYANQSIEQISKHSIKIVSKQQMNKIPMFNESFFIQKTFKVYLKRQKNKGEFYPNVQQSCQSFHYYFNQKCRRYLESIGDIYLQQGKGGKIPKQDESKSIQKDNSKSTQKVNKQIKNRTPIINTYLGNNYIDVTQGWFSLDPKIWRFVDNKYFQRLRKMKQNLALHHVSPCYNNTRFQHSLGVANLARRFIKTIIQNNQNHYRSQQQRQSAIKTVTIAGLLFNLGYTPFNNFLAKKQSIREFILASQELNLDKNQKFNDEEYSKYLTILLSLRLFDLMRNELSMKKNNNYQLTQAEIQRIKCLIIGKKNDKNAERIWQFQIVNDISHNIDAVNFDALLRDSFHLSAFNVHIDYELLINQCRIIDVKLCFPTKYTQHLNSIITTKIKLYKQYYKDQQTQKIQLILQDLMSTGQEELQLQSTILDILNCKEKRAENIILLVDEILQEIQNQKGISILKNFLHNNSYIFVQEIIYILNPSNGYFSCSTILESMQRQFSIQQYKKQPGIVIVTTSSFGFNGLKTFQSVSYFKKEESQNRQIPQNQKEGLTMLRIQQLALSLNFYIKWNQGYNYNKHRDEKSDSKGRKNSEEIRSLFYKDVQGKIDKEKDKLNGSTIGKKGTYKMSINKQKANHVEC